MSILKKVLHNPCNEERTNALWESILYLPLISYKSNLIIRVAIGGKYGRQGGSFQAAISALRRMNPSITDNITVELMGNSDIRHLNWSPEDLVDWLLGGHIHFVITHVHQGLVVKELGDYGWNMVDLYAQINRLKLHNGFPSHNNLGCPVFTQDKYEYIRACPEVCIPTIRIELIDYDQEYKKDYTSNIKRYIHK